MRTPALIRLSALAALTTLTAVAGCDVGNRPIDGSPGGFDAAGRDTGPMSRLDAAPFDPFDPANACGLSTVPTEQVPGSLLIVFDKSGSMDGEVGSSTKWDLATRAINNVLTTTGDDLSAGLMLFPSDGDCAVSPTPSVPIAPLSTSRGMISSALSSAGPGGNTPSFRALLAGYDYLDTLTTAGQRGIVLVSDGGETCDTDMADAVFARVQMEHDTKNRLTFAVGLDYADNNLSTIAHNGGTPRTPDCLPTCTSEECLDDSDCPGAGTCNAIEFMGLPLGGFCGCATDADCVAPQTCETPSVDPCAFFPPPCPFPSGPQCSGEANCCHYNAAASDFMSGFEAALADIARRLVDSCVFEVPRGSDPAAFDPALVNVGVTFGSESRQVLPRSDDSSGDSWNYVDTSNDTLIIQGPVCDRILEGDPATVEIVLGCGTILI